MLFLKEEGKGCIFGAKEELNSQLETGAWGPLDLLGGGDGLRVGLEGMKAPLNRSGRIDSLCPFVFVASSLVVCDVTVWKETPESARARLGFWLGARVQG